MIRRINTTTIVIVLVFIAGLVAGFVTGYTLHHTTIIIINKTIHHIHIPPWAKQQTCYCNNSTGQCICILNNETNITLSRWS